MQEWQGAWGSDGPIMSATSTATARPTSSCGATRQSWTVNLSTASASNAAVEGRLGLGRADHRRRPQRRTQDRCLHVARRDKAGRLTCRRPRFEYRSGRAPGARTDRSTSATSTATARPTLHVARRDESWTVNLSDGHGFDDAGVGRAPGARTGRSASATSTATARRTSSCGATRQTWTVNLSTGQRVRRCRRGGRLGLGRADHVGDLNGDGKTDVFMWRDSTNLDG